jgi:type I restriction enzyme S subunit
MKWENGKLDRYIQDFIVPQRDKPKVFRCRIEDIDGVYLSKSKSGKCVSQQTVLEMPLRLFPSGTVIVSCSADLGRCAIVSEPLVTNQTFIGLVPKATLDSPFLYYLMTSRADELNAAATGATITYLSQDKFKALSVSIPPLSEQRRIVNTLNAAFDGISTAKANAEKNLQNAGALFESYLRAAFAKCGEEWPEKSVGEIANHSLGKMLDKSKNKGEPQRYLRNLNVRWFTFDLSDLLEMRFLREEFTKYTAVKGDVLVCEGGYPGRAAIWNEGYPIYFQKALHRVRFHEREHNKWFVYFLYSEHKSGNLRQYFTGTGIQHFTGEALSRFRLPIPPLSRLRQLVQGFEELSLEIRRLESIYQQKVAALEAFKESLLHQTFFGAL